MKKIVACILALTILLTSFPYRIRASESKIAYTNDYVNVRVSPNSSGTRIESVDPGVRFNILKEAATNTGGCTGTWYQVSYYSGKTGYACGDYLTVYNALDFTKTAPTTEYEKELLANGFTDPSYWPYLTKLHEQHPTWQFVAYHPAKPTTFSYAVSQESDTYGKSQIQLVTKNFEGWKHIATLNYATNTFMSNFPGGGANWYAAAPEVVAYYMDPRNFINERSIFMFEVLSGFNENKQTAEEVQKLLTGTFMEGKPAIVEEDITRDLSYAEIFIEAAKQTGISPYSLVARVLQEIGRVRTTIATGTVEGFEGYFNFYNIRATGNPGQIIANGLTYAKEQGWDSEYDAIIGGALFLKREYVDAEQDNLYLQKWDISGNYYFTNQYMQNIEAPPKEAIPIYKGYVDNALLEYEFTFKIPVYQEMPDYTDLPNPASPNNWLKEITIGEKPLENFNPEVTGPYSYSVAEGVNQITIGATAISPQASIQGIGEIALTEKETLKTVTVTSGNGKTRDYQLKFVKSETTAPTVDEIVDNIGVKSDGTYISGLAIGTNTRILIDKVKNFSAAAVITIKDSNGTEKVDQPFGTGDTITITSGAETKTFQAVIYGDLNGDGQITILDLLRVQKVILGSTNLSEVYQKAGDVNRDNQITILDLLRVQKHILGAFVIEQ